MAYPAEYVNRLLRWGDSDVYDYQKFPERTLRASDSPFEFSLNLDEGRIRTQFEAVTGIDDFDSFLEKNRTQAFIVIQDDAILDENGLVKMESGINARAIDFAKFGPLFLRNGNWDGVQVVPAEWVAESTQADASVDYANYYYDRFIFANGQGYYKYMWWGIQRDEQNYDFMALGNHGQFIYISPHKNLMILRFGETYGDINGADNWVNMFYNFANQLE